MIDIAGGLEMPQHLEFSIIWLAFELDKHHSPRSKLKASPTQYINDFNDTGAKQSKSYVFNQEVERNHLLTFFVDDMRPFFSYCRSAPSVWVQYKESAWM